MSVTGSLPEKAGRDRLQSAMSFLWLGSGIFFDDKIRVCPECGKRHRDHPVSKNKQSEKKGQSQAIEAL
jgi:hypothetical protein